MRSRRFVADSAARDDMRTIAEGRARHVARAGAAVGRARRPARPRRLARRHPAPPIRRSARLAQLRCTAGGNRGRRWKRCAGPRAISRANSTRALAEQLPLMKRDGGFVREGYEPALDESAQSARRIPPRRRRDAGALCRRHRHQGAEDPAQQRARLFRRGHRAARRQADGAAAERDLHPSPDAGRAGALHDVRARRDRGQDRQCRRPRARARTGDLRAAVRRWRSPPATICAPPRMRSRCSTSRPRWQSSRSTTIMCGPRSTARSASPIEGGRHPVVEQALKRDGQPFIANACDLSPGPAQKSGQIWLITGPNMAGKSTFLRQNALIALLAQIGCLRAGDARADRRRRPAVLARRRRRRSGARALDLHGRDGRDRRRSSIRPASARW